LPNPNGHLIAAIIFTFDANAVTNNGYADAGGYCLHKDNTNCVWCSTGGAQPGNCKKGYAGCTDSATTANLYALVNINTSAAKTTWECTSSGWQASTTMLCDRYSYKNSSGECVLCPTPDFVYADSGEAPLPHGDNYQYYITGCNISVDPFSEYMDTTGKFVFTDGGQCNYTLN